METAPFLDLSAPGFSTRSRAVVDARSTLWCAETPYGIAILRHREAGQLLRDKRLRQGSHNWPARHGLKGSFARFWSRSIIAQEGDSHRTLRMVATRALSDDFVDGLRPGFDRIASDLVGQIKPGREIEFMSQFSQVYAGQVICHLLDLPLDRWSQVALDASDLGLAMSVDCKSHEKRVNAACDRLMALADDLVKEARRNSSEGFVARLLEAFGDPAAIDLQTVLDLIVIVIFGGVDTTRAQLGFAINHFANAPQDWQALRDDPDKVAFAIEEIIRQNPTTTWATREAVESFIFKGREIPKGQTVHILVHASALDPSVREDPAFDISKRGKSHFGFGGGAHHCIGHHMARTDMRSALHALSRRFEVVRPAGTAEWLPDSGNTSALHLPVTFS